MMGGTGTTSIHDILVGFSTYVSVRIMPILVGLAILAFLFNVIQFIYNNDNERQREIFKRYLINSLVALFILISIWGIVGLGTKTLWGSKPVIPQLPTSER